MTGVIITCRTAKGAKKMRILIAEDDPKLLKSLIHIFELNNYAAYGVLVANDVLVSATRGGTTAEITRQHHDHC